MGRQETRLRVDSCGQLEAVDPDFGTVSLLRTIDPNFQIQQAPLSGFEAPGVLRSRRQGCGIPLQDLIHPSEQALWALHRRMIQAGDSTIPATDEASLMDLKLALAQRVLSRCRLCAHRCGVDRRKGERGICQLGTEATVAEYFPHIGEEAPINPSLVFNLAGCGLRCRFCQQGPLLNPSAVMGEGLSPELWSVLPVDGVRSLSFVGGNPDESLYGILRFLSAMPQDWTLPTVWNSHAYSTPETMDLLEGIVDVFVPDFKYSNQACGRKLSGVTDYPETAEQTLRAMLAQQVPVIVRILVLPGHYACCHSPALSFLSSVDTEKLQVSVRGQYCPDWKIAAGDGALTQRPEEADVQAVRKQAVRLGLRLVDG